MRIIFCATQQVLDPFECRYTTMSCNTAKIKPYAIFNFGLFPPSESSCILKCGDPEVMPRW